MEQLEKSRARITADSRTCCVAEEEALRRLSVLDLEGARASVHRSLKEILDSGIDPIEASYLAYDLLCRVDRVVAQHEDLPQRGLVERRRTIRSLVGARSGGALAETFWGTYDELTHRLSGMTLPGHPAVEQVKIYVRQHYRRKISLAEIARSVGVSRNYLSHLFKKHCGVTVTEFIHRIRLKEAARLLTDGARTVAAVAYTVGYQNYRDFHRNFVKYEKTSPKKYRQLASRSRRAQTSAPSS